MQKFLSTLIYGTLAVIVIIYLFSAMHWPGFQGVALGILWLHVGAYLIYSLTAKGQEPRIIYPLGALTVVILVNIFKLGADTAWIAFAVYFFCVGYAAFHLLVKNYMGKNEISFLPTLNAIVVGVYLLAGIMKIMHLEFADVLFIGSSGAVAFMLLLTGATKGLKRQK